MRYPAAEKLEIIRLVIDHIVPVADAPERLLILLTTAKRAGGYRWFRSPNVVCLRCPARQSARAWLNLKSARGALGAA
jgi:hypothetical protein